MTKQHNRDLIYKKKKKNDAKIKKRSKTQQNRKEATTVRIFGEGPEGYFLFCNVIIIFITPQSCCCCCCCCFCLFWRDSICLHFCCTLSLSYELSFIRCTFSVFLYCCLFKLIRWWDFGYRSVFISREGE